MYNGYAIVKMGFTKRHYRWIVGDCQALIQLITHDCQKMRNTVQNRTLSASAIVSGPVVLSLVAHAQGNKEPHGEGAQHDQQFGQNHQPCKDQPQVQGGIFGDNRQ